MKKWIMVIIIIALILAGAGFYIYKAYTKKDGNNYEAEKTATETNTSSSEETTANKENKTTAEEKAEAEEQANEQTENNKNTPVEGPEIASFSTKIYTKDSSRQNNITITCSTLNDTDIANGATFSFCDTVGQSSPSRGYQEADIFIKGKKTKGYGGGNCQISTTLYNAVLNVPALQITERHEHSNKVPYIENGKDAAVAYGNYDFKFVNNTGYNIRIKATNTPDNVTINLIKLL